MYLNHDLALLDMYQVHILVVHPYLVVGRYIQQDIIDMPNLYQYAVDLSFQTILMDTSFHTMFVLLLVDTDHFHNIGMHQSGSLILRVLQNCQLGNLLCV